MEPATKTDDDRGLLIIGPWDDVPSELQRVIAEAVDWLATPYAVEEEAPYFEIALFGGRVSLCANEHASWVTLQTNISRRVLDWMNERAWRLW